MFLILAVVYFIMMFTGHILLKKPEGWHEPQKVFKPEHKRLDRGQITGSQTDTHDKTIAYVDTDKRQRALLMLAAVMKDGMSRRRRRRVRASWL